MTYNDDFKAVVDTGNYIGTGNPNAKILIIGKECAIDQSTEEGRLQYTREIENNARDWKNNILNKTNFDDVNSWFSEQSQYNPLFPYKGQVFKRNRGCNGGTSVTWCNYQKLCNRIMGNSSLVVDFHKDMFISELSVITALYSKDVNPDDRKKSINDRLILFENEFFQRFEIIILATGTDPRYQFDFERKFNVQQSDIAFNINGKEHRIYLDKTGKKKLLIHTNQFSFMFAKHGVPEEWIEHISELCRNFLSGL